MVCTGDYVAMNEKQGGLQEVSVERPYSRVTGYSYWWNEVQTVAK
jgi:hypothetical protein